MRTAKIAALVVVLLAVGLCASADVKLHGLFTDGMVLQQGKEVPVWGKADEGERVTVRFLNQTVSAVARNGKWMVRLKKMKAGGPYKMVVSGKNTIVLNDVYVGEVWVASGQSNMAMPVARCLNAEEEIANSRNPLIRLYTVPRKIAQTPQEDVEGQWMECNPDTVGSFSGVAYFFGRELQKALKVPVGLIHTSWGGTPAEAWTCKWALEKDPELKVILDAYEIALKRLPKAMERYKKRLEQYKEAVKKARKEGKKPPRRPHPPMGPENRHCPCGLYNAMIAPLIPYAIAGVIWYQGEANASRAYQYRKLFPAMITNWREDWKQGDFPFLFVQLAAFKPISPEPQESAWAELREAQLMTLSLPNTGMAVAIDVGDQFNAHPKNKQAVGARLALAARAIAYGEKIVYSGPIYKSMKIEDGKVILTFDHAGSGLVAKDGELKGFAICGADRKFVWAKAKIIGKDKVAVWSPDVPSPVAVRYAWADYPVCNLYNKEGLPASPFRTDDFPMLTGPKKQ